MGGVTVDGAEQHRAWRENYRLNNKHARARACEQRASSDREECDLLHGDRRLDAATDGFDAGGHAKVVYGLVFLADGTLGVNTSALHISSLHVLLVSWHECTAPS